MLTPVILSGGAGTRLWPLSRELYPKQLLALTGTRTMLQQTALRLEGLGSAAPVIVCNEVHRFLVAEQLRQLKLEPRAIVLEPAGRNTAPAIALAAHAALKGVSAGDPDPVLLVLPADHVIKDVPAFQRAVRQALPAAAAGKLVTFGIVPTAPETGYGYIQRGAASGALHAIARFVEKPDAARAAEFLASGEYYWNSGMFMFGARRYLSELARFAPGIARVCEAAFASARADLEFTRIAPEAFASCPSDSIDYAVMEKTADAVVVPLAAGWSDVGSWAALHDATEGDADRKSTRLNSSHP
jgi:mannose-1-phosphate guanylyltransferase/mannose-6-phosphate isomerase